MVQIWMARVDRELSERESAALTARLPLERRKRLADEQPRQQVDALCAYGLLLALLRERYGWTALPPMERTGNGKPFFPGHPQVHFSISHTAGAAAVAVSDVPVGVDIQHIQTPPRRLAYLTGLEEPEAFFRSWTQWEARAKRTGTASWIWSGGSRPWRRGRYAQRSWHFRDIWPLLPGRSRSRCGG